MRLLKFKNQREYLEAQRSTSTSHQRGPYCNAAEFELMHGYFTRKNFSPKTAVCHGARHGVECDLIQDHFPDVNIFGTDLHPFLGNTHYQKEIRSEVKEWNFSRPLRSWENHFDLIYSNSLDHARDPGTTLDVWFSQLTPGGWLVLQWTEGHTWVKEGDCFGASINEYWHLINTRGTLRDMLYWNRPRDWNDPLAIRAFEGCLLMCQRGRKLKKRRGRRGRVYRDPTVLWDKEDQLFVREVLDRNGNRWVRVRCRTGNLILTEKEWQTLCSKGESHEDEGQETRCEEETAES